MKFLLQTYRFEDDIQYHLREFKYESIRWSFEEINKWLSIEDQDTNRLLWLAADSGLGKSVFSATLSNQLLSSDKLLAAYFIRFDSQSKFDPYYAIRSIAYQIAYNTMPECQQIIFKNAKAFLDEAQMKQNKSFTVKDYFTALIQIPLQSCTTTTTPTRVIIIDGIDEINVNDSIRGRLSFLKFIISMLKALPKWVKIVVTGRKLEDIERIFTPKFTYIITINRNDPSHISNIQQYFHEKLQSQVKADSLQEAIEILIRKSEGNWIYVTTVVQFLIRTNEMITIKQLENLPDGLDNLYKYYFGHIKSTIMNQNISLETLISVLQLLVVAKEPLSTLQITQFLSLDSYTLSTIFTIMSIFFHSHVDSNTGKIRYYANHKSIIDWLLNNDMELFNINIIQSHNAIATQLITYIESITTDSSVPHVTDSSVQQVVTDDNDDNSTYHYTYLLDHLYEANRNSDIIPYIFNLYWLQSAIQVRGSHDIYYDMLKFSTYMNNTVEMKLLVDTIKLAVPLLQGKYERLPFQLFTRLRHVVRDKYILTCSDSTAEIPIYSSIIDLNFYPQNQGIHVMTGGGEIIVYRCDDTTLKYYELCGGQGYIPKILSEGRHWNITLQNTPYTHLKSLIEQCDTYLRRPYSMFYPLRYILPGPSAMLHKIQFTDVIRCVIEWNPEYIICGCGDKNIYFIEQCTGDIDEEMTLKGHTGGITALAIMSDGRIVSGASDETVRVWDVTTGVCDKVLEGHNDPISSIVVLSDGRVVSGSCDMTIIIWDMTAGESQCVLEGHSDRVTSLGLLSDGRIVSGSADTTLRIWNIDTEECEMELEGHTNVVSSVVVMLDDRILSGSSDMTIRIWDVNTGVCDKVLEGHTWWVWSLVMTADGHIISGGADKSIRVWDVNTGQCKRILDINADRVWSVAVLSNGHIASGSCDGTLRVWDVTAYDCEKIYHGHKQTISSLAMSNGRIVSSCSDEDSLCIWNGTTGVCERVIAGNTGLVLCMIVLSDGRIVSGSNDKKLRVWNIMTGICDQILEGHTSLIWTLAVTPDGHIISGSWDNKVRVWNIITGICERVFSGHNSWVASVAAMANNRVVSGSADNTIRIWNIETGNCDRIIEGHTRHVLAVLVMPDDRIVSGSADMTVRVWDTSTGTCERILEGHESWVSSLALLPDNHIVSKSKDGSIRVWNMSAGTCESVLEGDETLAMEVSLLDNKDFLNFCHYQGILSNNMAYDASTQLYSITMDNEVYIFNRV